jgi:hypothetical protein
MAILSQFDTPGSLGELSEDHRLAWSETVVGMFDEFTGDFPQFYNPTVENTPAGLRPAQIVWSAFPAQVFREKGPGPERLRLLADGRLEEEAHRKRSPSDATGHLATPSGKGRRQGERADDEGPHASGLGTSWRTLMARSYYGLRRRS